MPDSPDRDLKPDPRKVGTAAGLVETLDEFVLWAGEIPVRALADRSGQLVSSSTIHRALAGT